MFSPESVVEVARDIYAHRRIRYEPGEWVYYVQSLVTLGGVQFVCRARLAGRDASYNCGDGIIRIANDLRPSRVTFLVAHEIAESYLGDACYDGVEDDCDAVAYELLYPSALDALSGVYAIASQAAAAAAS